MGRPAARVTDLVVHVLPPMLGPGPGSTDVLIGGLPAWRGLPTGAVTSMPAPPEPMSDQEMLEEARKNDPNNELFKKDEDEEEGEEKPPTDEQLEAAAAAKQEAAAAEMASLAGGGGAGVPDLHLCAQPSPIPFCIDGPGYVITGSATVLINGLPACRQGDMILEALGPPNMIAMGCPTVLIGG